MTRGKLIHESRRWNLSLGLWRPSRCRDLREVPSVRTSEAGSAGLVGDTWTQGSLLFHYSGWSHYWVCLLPGSSLVQEDGGFEAEAVTDGQCHSVGAWVLPERQT